MESFNAEHDHILDQMHQHVSKKSCCRSHEEFVDLNPVEPGLAYTDGLSGSTSHTTSHSMTSNGINIFASASGGGGIGQQQHQQQQHQPVQQPAMNIFSQAQPQNHQGVNLFSHQQQQQQQQQQPQQQLQAQPNQSTGVNIFRQQQQPQQSGGTNIFAAQGNNPQPLAAQQPITGGAPNTQQQQQQPQQATNPSLAQPVAQQQQANANHPIQAASGIPGVTTPATVPGNRENPAAITQGTTSIFNQPRQQQTPQKAPQKENAPIIPAATTTNGNDGTQQQQQQPITAALNIFADKNTANPTAINLFNNNNVTTTENMAATSQTTNKPQQPLHGIPPSRKAQTTQNSANATTNNNATTTSAQQPIEKDQHFEQEIESARKLNGSLHMFCQNMHRYRSLHVRAFFNDPVIFTKLSNGLSKYNNKHDSSTLDEWEKLKNEARNGSCPLKFWNERLSRYKYQYILILLIEELADYLQISTMECYSMFNIFLSHDPAFVEYFFDASTNEPCIEYFYEIQALVFDTSNVAIRKESSFIAKLRTRFMREIYFHERNCLIASLRLLLLITQDHENAGVVNETVLRLVLNDSNPLEKSLWKQYESPQWNVGLSSEDAEAFAIQIQFEEDQIIKLLYILSERRQSGAFPENLLASKSQKNQSTTTTTTTASTENKYRVSLTDVLARFLKESFLGNFALQVPLQDTYIENKDKINEYSVVIGDSCLMLVLSLVTEHVNNLKKYKNTTNNNNNNGMRGSNQELAIADIIRQIHASKTCQQVEVLKIALVAMQKDLRGISVEQIEDLYKTLARVLKYKNLGVLKPMWQQVFFEIVWLVIAGLYDSDIVDWDEYMPQYISDDGGNSANGTVRDHYLAECLARALAITIDKNAELIDSFWERLEEQTTRDQFKMCFKSPISLYKIMKNAMGQKDDAKVDKVIVYLSNVEHFSFYWFFANTQHRNMKEIGHALMFRLLCKLICVDTRCIQLLELQSKHEQLSLQLYDTEIAQCTGDSIIQYLVSTLSVHSSSVTASSHSTLVTSQKSAFSSAKATFTTTQSLSNGLKAINALLNQQQQQTTQILRIEQNQMELAMQYQRVIQYGQHLNLSSPKEIKYNLRAKREILSLLHSILLNFEEPLLAFSLPRATAIESPLLIRLMRFYVTFTEEWDQILFEGVSHLNLKWKIGSLLMKISRLCFSRLVVNVNLSMQMAHSHRPSMLSDSYTSMFLNVILMSHLRTLRIEEMMLRILEVSPEENKDSFAASSVGTAAAMNLTRRGVQTRVMRNQLWQMYLAEPSVGVRQFQEESMKNQKNLKQLIVESLKLFSCIIQLTTSRFVLRKQSRELFHEKETLLEDFPILDFFESALCKHDRIYHYTQEYIDDTSIHRNAKKSGSMRQSDAHSLNSSVTVLRVNLIYAIAAYVNFESHFYARFAMLGSAAEEPNPTLHYYLYSLLENEASLINSLGDAHLLIDYDSIRSPLNKVSLPSGDFSNSISAQSLRILTGIMLLWDASYDAVARRPVLVDFISACDIDSAKESVSAIISWNDSATRSDAVSNFINEMMQILRMNENADSSSGSMNGNVPSSSNYESFDMGEIVARKHLSEESCAVIDFMITALHSQPLIMSVILKPITATSSSKLNTRKPESDFKIRFKRFFESATARFDMRLLNKYLTLLSEIFSRDSQYASFCREFRSGTQEMFERITRIIMANFKPYELDALLEQPVQKSVDAFHQDEFVKWKLGSLLRDHVRHTSLHKQFATLNSFQILLNLLSTEFLSKKLKSVSAIQNSLRVIFDSQQMQQMLLSMGKFTWKGQQHQPQQPKHEQQIAIKRQIDLLSWIAAKESNRSAQNAVSLFLDVNVFGYGRNFGVDSDCVVFSNIDSLETNEGSNFELGRAAAIVKQTIQIRSKSMRVSVEENKARAIDAWVRLLCLILSSGTEGFAMSCVSSATADFTVKQLRESRIVETHEEMCLLYPNYEIEFVSGFVQILATCKIIINNLWYLCCKHVLLSNVIEDSQCVAMLSNVQNELMKQIMSDLKKALFGKLLDLKLQLLLAVLNALRHLQDVERLSQSRYSNTNSRQQSMPLYGGYFRPGSSALAALIPESEQMYKQQGFKDSYRVDEAENHVKFMAQILNEAVSKENMVNVCDFLQSMFVQLSILEMLHKSADKQDSPQQQYRKPSEGLSMYLSQVTSTLMNLFASDIDGLPILVSCLNSILHIYPDFLFTAFSRDKKAVSFLLHKAFNQSNPTAQIFISLASFLQDFACFPEGAELLRQSNIISTISESPLFSSIESEPFYWQNGERNLIHSFYCFTLSLCKEYMLNMPIDLESILDAIAFLQRYFTRIAKVLSIPSVLNSIKSTTSGVASSAQKKQSSVPSELEKLSLAFLEEIEQTAHVISVLYCQSNVVQKQLPYEFEYILQLLTHNTVNLFKHGLYYPSVFMPVSKMERKLEEIQTYTEDPIFDRDLMQSSSTNTRITEQNRKNNLLMVSIEVMLCSLQLSVFSSIFDGLHQSNLLSLFTYNTITATHLLMQAEGTAASNRSDSIVYAVSYWQSMSNSILDSLRFVENMLNRWESRSNRKSRLDQTLLKLLSLTSGSVEFNLCCYGFTPTRVKHARDVQLLAQQSLSQILGTALRHFQLYNEFKQWFGHSITDSLYEIFARILGKLEIIGKIEGVADVTLKREITVAIAALHQFKQPSSTATTATQMQQQNELLKYY